MKRSLSQSRSIHILIAAIVILWLVMLLTPSSFAQSMPAKRIVSIGGSVSEIVAALGQGDRLVARDRTSVYPNELNALPDIGYIRQLSAEGVLSVNPDMILSLEGAGPPEAISVLKASGTPFIEIPEGYDRVAVINKIEAVGQALGVEAKAQILAKEVDAALAKLAAQIGDIPNKKTVLFVLSLRGQKLFTAGKGTHADGMIAMAGATNAIDKISGYKQVTDEALIEANPDVILLMRSRNTEHGSKAILQHPALASSTAAKEGAVIEMDALYLLGFGPRTAAAAQELNAAIYPK